MRKTNKTKAMATPGGQRRKLPASLNEMLKRPGVKAVPKQHAPDERRLLHEEMLAASKPLLERIPPKSKKGWAGALCCYGACLEEATWWFAPPSTPEERAPYCDQHLPAASGRPKWHLRFAPVGQPAKSVVDSHDLLKVLEQGFQDGAVQCLVRRTV